MALLTTTGTTSTTDVNDFWRTVETVAYDAISLQTPELGWMNKVKTEDIPWSFKATNLKLNLNEDGAIAVIGEGGYKAQAQSSDLETASITLSYLSGRFSFTDWAELADKGQRNQVRDQIKGQAKNKTAAIGRAIGRMFWGSSTGVLATTDTDLSSTTVVCTVTAGFGNTAITNGDYICSLFRVGDRYAFFNGSTLVEFGTCTAVTPATPSVSFTLDSNPSVTANGLKIVAANSIENSTSDGTDFNKWFPGMNDILGTGSLHGLTHANWALAYSDTTTGGRMNGIRWRKGDQMVEDYGPSGASIDLRILDRGVELDMIDYERPGLRFSSPMGMEIDGDVKMRGKMFEGSKNVPPGWAVGISRKHLGKIELTPQVNENPDNAPAFKVQEYQDRTVKVAELRMLLGTVVRSRKGFVYYTGLTRKP